MKVGDKVRVKAFQHCLENFSYFNKNNMERYCGKIGTIIKTEHWSGSACPDGIAYMLDISSNDYYDYIWNIDCLELISTSTHLMPTE